MKSIVFIILGFFLLIKGADVLVKGASNIAVKFHIPEIIVGLTIVSIGTSLPELMISVKSAINGASDISLGNVLGSCICNILLILGASAIFSKIPIDKESKKALLPLTLISMVIIFIFGNINSDISRAEGIMLLGFFAIFMIYIINNSLSLKETEKNKISTSIFKNIIYLIIGAIGLKFGGDFVVNEASNIARLFNISEKIIGLTIVSIGTSLPEFVTSVVAGRKGNTAIAFGNIIGSNLFNLLLVLGLSSAIRPIAYSYSFNFSLILLMLVTLLILIFDKIGEKSYLNKKKGWIMLLMYVEYMFFLIYQMP